MLPEKVKATTSMKWDLIDNKKRWLGITNPKDAIATLTEYTISKFLGFHKTHYSTSKTHINHWLIIIPEKLFICKDLKSDLLLVRYYQLHKSQV